ncbi:MAG: hypothetical protein LBV32_04015 [Tannerellaceae bacterium]|jgi:hypothetical protein|nr:hypothetical protein [Tannerellaceae bacterium]
MEQQTRTTVFYVAAISVLCGAILHFIQWFFAPYLFALGAAGVAVCFLTLPVRDMDFRRKRLHRYNIFSGLLMVFASALMFSNRKEWILCLTVATIFLLYTSFASPSDKENS